MTDPDRHEGDDNQPLTVHLLIISNQRTPTTERSGLRMREMLEAAGHRVTGCDFIPVNAEAMRSCLVDLCSQVIDGVIMAGGTGLHPTSHATASSVPQAQAPAPNRDESPPVQGIVLTQEESPAIRPVPEPAPSATGWNAALTAMGATLLVDQRIEIPDPISWMAGACNVLESAGQQAVARLSDGTLCGLYGFPDLVRPGSKVLLVGPGEPRCQVLALHRYPRLAGLPIIGDPFLPDARSDGATQAERITGQRCPFDGELFAVDGSVVYLLANDRVRGWNGRKATDDGLPKPMVASLLLRWSQN